MAGSGSQLKIDASEFVAGMVAASKASGDLQSALNRLVDVAKTTNGAAQQVASATKQMGASTGQVTSQFQTMAGAAQTATSRVSSSYAQMANQVVAQTQKAASAHASLTARLINAPQAAAAPSAAPALAGGVINAPRQFGPAPALAGNIINPQVTGQVNSLNTALQATHQAVFGLAAIRLAEHFYNEFKQATQEAAEFQRSIALIRTITQDANLSQSQWADGIKKVSDELGKPIGEVAAASYDLLSNQLTKGADTFDVVRTAAELAKATNARTEDSVNALSSAFNSFGLKTYEVKGVAAEFFSVIDLGRIKMDEIANSSGRPFLFGQSLGASFREINSAVVALTQSGVQSNTAYTLINNVFQKLLNPTKELKKFYQEIGVASGESFIKTYGLVGALEKLRDATGGSSAELAKFFNEIRGEQGVSALITKLDVVKKAMADAATAGDRYGKANEIVGGNAGNAFLVEAQKLQNDLTTGLNTNLLEAVSTVSGAFGGLAAAMHTVVETSVGLASAWALLKVGTLVGQLTTATAAFGALGIAIVAAANIYRQFQEAADQAHEAIVKSLEDRDRLKEERVDEGLRKGTEEFSKKVTEATRAKLEEFATVRKALNKIGDAAEEVGDQFREGFKNSVQLAMSSIREELQATTARLNKMVEGVRNIDKDRSNIRTFGQDTLYSARKTAIDVAYPGKDHDSIAGKLQAEAQLAQQRLNQYSKQLQQALKSGDHELFNQILSSRQQLIHGLASETFTDADGVVRQKYLGIEQGVNRELEYQYAMRNKLQAVMKQQARELEAQRILEQDTVKELEDAAAKLNKDLKSTETKSGQRRFASADEQEAQVRRDFAKVDDLFKKLQEGRGEKGVGIPEHLKELQEHRIREVRRRFEETARAARTGTEVEDAKDLVNKGEEGVNKAGTAALAGWKEKSEAVSRLTKEYDTYNRALEANLTLLEENKVNKNPLLGEARKQLESGDFKSAIDNLEKYRQFIASSKAPIADQVTNKGGRHEYTTDVLFESIKQAQVLQESVTNLKAAQAAQAQAAAQNVQAQATPAIEAMKALLNGSQELTRATQGSASAISSVFNSTDAALQKALDSANQLIGKLDEIANKQSLPSETPYNPAVPEGAYAESDWSGGGESEGSYATGGFVRYLARGGLAAAFAAKYSKGTDTIPALLSPGEFVVRANQAQRFGPTLERMNAGFYADGGDVGGSFPGSLTLMNPSGSSSGVSNTTNVGDINVHVAGGNSSQQTINQIASGIQRGIRRGTIKMGR